MPSDPEFVSFALDLLAPVGPVQARSMFGGHGLYARGVMFGLLDGDELFLKTDAESRARWVEAGCRRWTYGRMESTSYYRPPDEAHEDPEAMEPWARLALEAALRTAAAKAGRGTKRPRRRAAPAKDAAKAAAGAAPRRRAGGKHRRGARRR